MIVTMHANLTPLDRITPADEPRSGAKAYNCARLKEAGFRVPDGLVVLTTAADADIAAVADHPWFDQCPPNEVFAVRSSGVGEDSSGQSFAGIHQTMLDVPRADVARAVGACRASARSPQALEYRRAKGLPIDSIQIGVLIQRMIHPVAAGVAFTVNPLTGERHELIINSSWGLGEALVSGQVEPDEFVVSKADGEVVWSRIGGKGDAASSAFSLSVDRVRELTRILIDLERHFGAPQDVEWCFDGAEFWIVQSRPITASVAPGNETEWTRANLAEVLPDIPSPQALYALEDLLNRAERQNLGRMMASERVLGPMARVFHGRMYFNLSQLRHVCALGGIPPAMMLKSMGHADAIDPADEKPQPTTLGERLSCIPDFVRIVSCHLRAASIVRHHGARTREILGRFAAADPRSLADREVWSPLEQWLEEAADRMQPVLLLGGVLFHETPVRKLCEKAGFAFERLVFPQLAVGERSVSAQQAFDLIALADSARREPAVARYLANPAEDLSQVRTALRGSAFLAEFERFLEKYGHRGRYESDWSLPRYHEDPTPLLLAIRAHLESSSESAASDTARRQERESAEAWTAFAERLSTWQRWTTLPRIRRSIRRIKQYYVWRERVRSDLVRVLAAVRRWHLVLAERFVDRGWLERRDDYFFLRLDEIASVIRGNRAPESLRIITADRMVETARHRSIRMPLLMRESELARLIRTAGVSSRSTDEKQLAGHPVSPGCVEAEVVVVLDPGDFGRMKRGAILVAPATDPSWTPLFTLASGVIVEVGGALSHASTIAREYGLPAIANVKHATKRLRTGERVRLDATQGLIQRLDPELSM